jgi:hypothetical protein
MQMQQHLDTPIGGGHMHLPNQLGPLPLLNELAEHVDSRPLAALICSLTSEGIVPCAGLWIDPQQRNSDLEGVGPEASRGSDVEWRRAKAHDPADASHGRLDWKPGASFLK